MGATSQVRPISPDSRIDEYAVSQDLRLDRLDLSSLTCLLSQPNMCGRCQAPTL